MGTTDKRRPCCFCGNLLSWTDVDELPDRTVRCQDKIPCRDRHTQRIADLEGQLEKAHDENERVEKTYSTARVEALRKAVKLTEELGHGHWVRVAMEELLAQEQRTPAEKEKP